MIPLGLFCSILVALWRGWLFAVIFLFSTIVIMMMGRLLHRRISIAPMQRRARILLQQSSPAHFSNWNDWPVISAVRTAIEEYQQARPGEEIILGRVDNDGRLWGAFGPLPGWIMVTEETFVPRYRFPLDVVLVDGKVLVRKDFRGDHERFVREWHNLSVLMGEANVPAVFQVDEGQMLLYKNLIIGQTIRDILVEAGAEILNVHTDKDQTLAHLNTIERLHTILARGTKLLPELFPESFFLELERQMNAIHRLGFAQLSLTFGNIMVDGDGAPWFIDLEGAQSYSLNNTVAYRRHRDQDRVKFNRIYGREAMTEAKARSDLQQQQNKLGGWYSPIDFGGGLAVGGFWSIDSGTGRWDYLNERVMTPLVRDKRVLDLGSNNGLMSLLMLRAGAKEVVGIELSADFVASAHLVHRLFEWRDMRSYPFTIHQCNMLDILQNSWQPFDVITSLCTLYYLEPDEMVLVVRKAAELAPVMIVQANDSTRAEAGNNKAEKSSLEYLKRLLFENGFRDQKIFAPAGYSRPLIVGKRRIHDPCRCLT